MHGTEATLQGVRPASSPEDRPNLPLIAKRYRSYLFPIILLGMAAGGFEGIGIGLLVPLVVVVLAGSVPRGLPAPLEQIASYAGHFPVPTQILLFGLTIVALVLAKGLFQATCNVVTSRTDLLIARDIRNALADRIVKLDYVFFLGNDSSRVFQILAHDSWVLAEGVRHALTALPAVAIVLVYAGLLAWLDWRLLAIVAISALVVVALVMWFERRQRQLGYALTDRAHILGQRMITIVNGVRAIRLFGQQPRELSRFAANSEELRQVEFKTRRISAIAGPVIDTAISAIFVVVLLASYVFAVPIIRVSAFMLLLLRAQPQAAALSQAMISAATVRGSMREVTWLLEQRETLQPVRALLPVASLDRPIRFEAVDFSYPDETVALKGIDVAIEPGAVTALIGRSGAGKTTFVNLLCRLVVPDHGRILFGDRDAVDFAAGDWTSRIAVAGQSLELTAGSIAENIAYGRPDASVEEIEAAAAAAGAREFIRDLPLGFATRVDHEGVKLSSGQRQRLGLARALLLKPDLLILDEATSAIDALSESEILQLLSERRYFRTALVISHRRGTLSACQHGIVIEKGRIVEAGPLATLDYYKTMGETAL